jgi:hypothetical protein
MLGLAQLGRYLEPQAAAAPWKAPLLADLLLLLLPLARASETAEKSCCKSVDCSYAEA